MTAILVLFLFLGAAFFVMHRIEKRYDRDVRDGEEQKSRGLSQPPPSPRPMASPLPVPPSQSTSFTSSATTAGPTLSTRHSASGGKPFAGAADSRSVDGERIAGMERAVEHMEGSLLELKAELKAFREEACAAEKSAILDGRPGMPDASAAAADTAFSPVAAEGQEPARETPEPSGDWKPGGEFVSPNLPEPGVFGLAAKTAAPSSLYVEGDWDRQEWLKQEAEAMPAGVPGAKPLAEEGKGGGAAFDQAPDEATVSGSSAEEGWGGGLPSGASASPPLAPGEGARRPKQFAAAFAQQHGADEGQDFSRQRRPAAVAEPGFLERAWQSLGELGLAKFLGASNIWVLAGIGLLLVGLVFLVRFAIEYGILGPEARLGVAGLVGLALLSTGWRHRETRRELGLILQGGGVGALYLTVVAAVKLYELLPQPLALALLVGIVVFSTVIAIIQNAKIMAHIANAAGFLAPVLVSSDSGNYVALFSYFILLNLGIIGVSRFRQWRSLHLTAFVFTAGIGGLWGMHRFEPALFFSVEPFLLAFFAIFTYLAIAGSRPSSFSLHRKADTFIDAPLTLGTPLVFILYQATISQGRDFVLAFTCLALGLLYLSIARFLWNARNNTASEANWMERSIGRVDGKSAADTSAVDGPEDQSGTGSATDFVSDNAQTPDREAPFEPDTVLAALIRKGRTLQAEIYLAFGILFTNLALPLALYDLGLYNWGERLLSLIWALEGASLVWLGRRNAMRLFRIFGMFSLALGFIYVLRYASHGVPLYLADTAEALRLGGGTYLDLGISLLLHVFGAASFMAAALAVHRYKLDKDETPEAQKALRRMLVGGAAVWLYGAFLFEFSSLVHYWELVLLACALTALPGNLLARRFDWRELAFTSLACYVPFLILFVPQALFGQIGYTLGIFSTPAEKLWTFGTLLLFTLYDLFLLRRSGNKQPPLLGHARLVGMLNALPVILTVCTVTGVALLTARPASEGTRFLPNTWLLALCVVWPCLFLGLGVGREKLLHFTGTLRQAMAASALPATLLVFWFAWNLFAKGDPAPLPYIPVLNPLEAGLLISAAALYIWVTKVHAALPVNPVTAIVSRQASWVVVLFMLANVTVARVCAFWLDMPFTLSGVMRNGSCQGVMAVLWALTGFAAMLHGHKTLQRSLWLSGVVLILADVIKLFLIDLTRVETLWRIVAFMAVGLLLILIGYKVPLPPARKAPETGEAEDAA